MNPTALVRPYVMGPGEGRDLPLARLGTIHKVPSEATSGRVAIVEHTLPPRHLAAPLHRHSREDELSIVLSGRLGAMLGGELVVAPAGAYVFKPRHQWHTFWNAGDTTCRLLEIISPAGFEHFFNELGERMTTARAISLAEVADLQEFAAGYGHYFQPDSIARLCAEHGLVYPG